MGRDRHEFEDIERAIANIVQTLRFSRNVKKKELEFPIICVMILLRFTNLRAV